jgi:hypothetical protein
VAASHHDATHISGKLAHHIHGRDFARELGVSLSTVQHYLRKGRPPRAVAYLTPAEITAEHGMMWLPHDPTAVDVDPLSTQRKTRKSSVNSGSPQPDNVVKFNRRKSS